MTTQPRNPDTQPTYFRGPITEYQARMADMLYGCGPYQTRDGQYWLPREYQVPLSEERARRGRT